MGAMQEEMVGLRSALQGARTINNGARPYTSGTWHGQPVVLVLSRIGKVAAATTATALIERFDVTEIVFTGVAGGLAPGVNVGDMVVATEFVQHDMDASPLFAPLEVPLYGRAHFPTDAALTQSLRTAAQGILRNPGQWVDMDTLHDLHVQSPKVHAGLVLSGDRFVSTSAESKALNSACLWRWRSKWRGLRWLRCVMTMAYLLPQYALFQTAQTMLPPTISTDSSMRSPAATPPH